MIGEETVQALKGLLPILSLLVALLAVFVSPLVSYIVVSKQIKASGKTTEIQIDTAKHVANRHLISPLRQKWIDRLRESLAEFFSNAESFKMLGSTRNSESDFHRLVSVVTYIELMLNANENDHNELLDSLKAVVGLANGQIEQEQEKYWNIIHAGKAQAKQILKKEWERVKNEI